MIESLRALDALWSETRGSTDALSMAVLTGSEPVLPSSFAMGVLAQSTIAAAGLAAAELWRLRTGRRQRVEVDMRHAIEEFRSERRFLIDGELPHGYRDPLAGIYQCGEGGWARPHLTFPHHRDGILRLLGCDPRATDKQALQRAFGMRDSRELEEQAAAAGLPLAALRAFAEWDVHPQGVAVAAMPLIAIERIGDAPLRRFALSDSRPLAGIRVLELARIIAGPVCGRDLAAHGADVLAISAAHLPSVKQLAMDMGRGKLSSHLDLRASDSRERLRKLLSCADVMVQAYRPDALAALGFGAEDVARIKPGIVVGELSAWGWSGPWGGRRGYDSLVQTATGFNHAEAKAANDPSPRELPVQALDHASGYLLAFGVMRAMARQVEEGGTWRVRVCLARTGVWLRSLGRSPFGSPSAYVNEADLSDLLEEHPSGFGRMTALRHSAVLSETPAHWLRPSVPLGASSPGWPDL